MALAVEAGTSADLGLCESIENAKKSLDYCLCNRFTLAETFIKDLDDTCMYHAISEATISYLQAVFTYEHELIDIAYIKVKKAMDLCNRFRKKQSLGGMVSGWVGRTNFDDFSEMELHAELCYAECLLEKAMLTFIQDENLINFIKGGITIRSAYGIYRYCLLAVDQKAKSLTTSKNKVDFESGVYMGMGTFNVLLSLLPPRVLRLLEWVGFGGDKRSGLNWLDKGLQIDGLRSSLCAITLLGYQVVVAPLLGLVGDTDISYVKKILGIELGKFPNSSIFLYFSGRLRQSQGNIQEALSEYKKSVSTNIDWHQVHHICYWEMMWCYSFLGEWQLAAQYGEILSTESKWSKCSYIYMHAAFLMMHQYELMHSGDEEKAKEAGNMTEHIDKIMNTVKEHKQRIAGKSIPFEKFSIARADKYQSTGKLVLPGLEIMHLWNGFPVFAEHTKMLEHFLGLSTLALEELKKETNGNKKNSKEHHDNVCLCMLIQGICLRHLKRTDEAEKTLTVVAKSPSSAHSCKIDSYFPPYAAAELGSMYLDNGEEDKALKQYQYTLNHYTKYGLESRLHFRVHGGIELIKENRGGPLQSKSVGTSPDIVSEDEFFDVLEDMDINDANTSVHNTCISDAMIQQNSPRRHSDTEILKKDDHLHESDTKIHKSDVQVNNIGIELHKSEDSVLSSANGFLNCDVGTRLEVDVDVQSTSSASSFDNITRPSNSEAGSICSDQ